MVEGRPWNKSSGEPLPSASGREEQESHSCDSVTDAPVAIISETELGFVGSS
jgi:hypothetical protein